MNEWMNFVTAAVLVGAVVADAVVAVTGLAASMCTSELGTL